jgi:uncharacterized protein YbaR (Trm112 family)
MNPDLQWIERWLPLLRCPSTGQALRMADDDDKVHHPQAILVSQDGSKAYHLDQGILVLLPQG